jgi:hypothetical protein
VASVARAATRFDLSSEIARCEVKELVFLDGKFFVESAPLMWDLRRE